MSIRSVRPVGARLRTLALALIATALASPSLADESAGHGGHGGHGGSHPVAAGPTDGAGKVDVELVDLEVVDRNGTPMRFRSEAMADRIVAINFVYTTCTTICPVLSALFAQVQDQLGPRLGPEVRLVSMSIDPARDTPKRMAAEAAKFDAAPGWLWLTGRKNDVDRVLMGLDAYSPAFEEHASMILIGDAKRGVWRRLFGFVAPEDIVAVIDEFAAARAAANTN